MNESTESNSKSSTDTEVHSDQDTAPATSSTTANSDTKFQNTNVYLSAYSGGSKQKMSLLKLLNDAKPKYIILYDSELRFVRQIEIYKAINHEQPLRVYFFMYSNSVEEQRYLTSIRREKEAFEILIKEKAVSVTACFVC